MATGGELGASGGGGGASVAATRIDVIDPHVLVMMRDVMSDSDSTVRLNVASGAGGGGGGGGGAGGTGGVIVLITTKASVTGSVSAAGGEKGVGGGSTNGQAAGQGQDGKPGKIVHIIV